MTRNNLHGETWHLIFHEFLSYYYQQIELIDPSPLPRPKPHISRLYALEKGENTLNIEGRISYKTDHLYIMRDWKHGFYILALQL